MQMYIHMHVHVSGGMQFPLGFNSLKALRKSSSVNLKWHTNPVSIHVVAPIYTLHTCICMVLPRILFLGISAQQAFTTDYENSFDVGKENSPKALM